MDEPCDGSKGCPLCNPDTAEELVFRKREQHRLKGKRRGERSKRSWARFWMPGGKPSVKQLESRRIRARERQSVQRGDDMPCRLGNGRRWEPWNWD